MIHIVQNFGKYIKSNLTINFLLKKIYIVINDILLLIQFRINGLMAINYKRSQRLLKLYLKFQGGTEVGFIIVK